MTSEAVFWDNLAVRYAALPIKDMDSYQRTMQRTRSYLRSEDVVLELGCGTGSTALLLSDAVRHITASDFSPEMIALGQDKARDQKIGNVSFVVAEPGGAALGDDRFDAVLAFNLFHLIKDRDQALASVRDQLRPGGVFVSKTPCLRGLKGFLRIPIFFMQLVGKAPYVGFLRPRRLEQQIVAAGFEIIESSDLPAGGSSRFIVARRP